MHLLPADPLFTPTLRQAATCTLNSSDVRGLLEEFYHATGGPWWSSRGTGYSEWLSGGDACYWLGVQCAPFTPTSYNIDLDNNNLTGSLPASWSRFCSLSTLILSNNHLSGPLPAFGADFGGLNEITLSGNNFTGPLPEEWCEIPIGILELARNNLTGAIPPCLLRLSRASTIDLSSNRFHGTMPSVSSDTLWNLDLSNNQLSGALPSEWDITSFWGSSMLTIDLGHNQFTGPIPEKLVGSSVLSKLVLSHNNLSGPLPQAITNSSSLQILLLGNNHLEGPFPEFVRGTRSLLSIVDISNNVMMNGSIPDATVQAMPNLAYLSLAGNTRMSAVSTEGKPVTWLGLNFGELGARDGRMFACPDPVTVAPFSFKVITPIEFFGYDQCRCSAGFVGMPPHGCKPCPPHMVCNSTKGRNVAWPRGFYPVFSAGEWVAALPCPDYGRGSDSVCNPENSCSARWNSKQLSFGCQLCAPGTTGRLCSRCQCPAPEGAAHSCYFASQRRCIACRDDVTVAVTSLLAAVIAAVVGLAVASCVWPRRPFFAALRRAAGEVGESGATKVALMFAQTTATVNSGWPEWAQTGGMRLLGVANASVAGTGIECLLNWMSDPVANLGAVLALVPAATVVIGAVVAVRAAWWRWAARRPDDGHGLGGPRASVAVTRSGTEQQSLALIVPPEGAVNLLPIPSDGDRGATVYRARPWESGVRAWLWVAYWLVLELSVRTTDVFNCTQELRTSSRWMNTVPWLRCNREAEWGTMQIMGFVSLGVLVCGIPVAFAAVLFAFRRRAATGDSLDDGHGHDEQRAMTVAGPLVACYRPSMHWFELGVTLRRMLVGLMVGFVPDFNLARSGFLELVLVGSLAVQHWLAPFKRARDNRLEELALGTAAFTFAVQGVWHGMNQLESATIEQVSVAGNDYGDILVTVDSYASSLMALLVGLNVTVLALLVAFALWPFVAPLWTMAARRWHASPSLRSFSVQ